jgi:hypothetical protein
MAKTQDSGELQVLKLQRKESKVFVLGESPLVMNSMSFKAKQGLLAPSRTGRMTSAEKAANLKHNPLKEYRESAYKFVDALDGVHSSRMWFKASGFKQAIMTAALDTQGAKKAQIGRLLRVEGESVEIFGVPKLWITGVKGADINRTPDMRTRAILPKWCAVLHVTYVTPNLSEHTVATLLNNAGEVAGVGDGRQEKGALDYGRWQLVLPSNPDFQEISKLGREAQDEALKDPACYNGETLELYEWFNAEMARRGVNLETSVAQDMGASFDVSPDGVVSPSEVQEDA